MDSIALVSTWAIVLSAALSPQANSPGNTHWDPHAPCFRWPAVDMDQDGVFDRIDHCVSTPKGCVVDAYGCETDSDGDGVCDGRDHCLTTPRGMKVDANGCAQGESALGSTKGSAEPKALERPATQPHAPSPPVSEMERQLISTGNVQ